MSTLLSRMLGSFVSMRQWLGLFGPIHFSRVLLQGREGLDAQAARLWTGDVLLRVAHRPTPPMFRTEVEQALGVRSGGTYDADFTPGAVVWHHARGTQTWNPKNLLQWEGVPKEHQLSPLFVHTRGQKLPQHMQYWVQSKAETPPPLGHFHDYDHICNLIDLAESNGKIWSSQGFITLYAILGPAYMHEASV